MIDTMTDELETESDEIRELEIQTQSSQEAMREKNSIVLNKEDLFHEMIQNSNAEARLKFPIAQPLDLRDMNEEVAKLIIQNKKSSKRHQISLYGNKACNG